MASENNAQADPSADPHAKASTASSTANPSFPNSPDNTKSLEAPSHEYILTHQESQGYLVTSPLMSEASLPSEQDLAHASTQPTPIHRSMDYATHDSPTSNNSSRNSSSTPSATSIHHPPKPVLHHPTRTNPNHSLSRADNSNNAISRNPPQSSASVAASGQYHLSVATFHKRNQDTNSFRTGQQFLIKLDLKTSPPDTFKNPLSLSLPRKMIQGHPKKHADSAAATPDPSTSSSTNTTSELKAQDDDMDGPLGRNAGPSKFFLEVTVHLASSEAIVQACPECCHKVEGKVRKPSTGPGAPVKTHLASDNVDPGQILQFCVSDNVVDFTNGTSTVMAKVLCSSTHHDKRGNNDRYFFKFSLMQYIHGKKIRIDTCSTKDILFTGNHKNKSMASFSEDKGDTKPRGHRPEEDPVNGPPAALLMGLPFYSEEPDSIPDEPMERSYNHTSEMKQSYHGSTHSAQPSRHASASSYGGSHHYQEHIPRIQEPMVVDASRQRRQTSGGETRSPLVPQGTSRSFSGTTTLHSHTHAPSLPDPRQRTLEASTGYNGSGASPTKSKSWNDMIPTPEITRIIPDAGDMLGGTEVTLFGSGFRDGLIPYFDSLPATHVTVLHSNVLTCRTPPRISAAVASVSFHPKSTSNGVPRRTAEAQYSYADKTGLALAELVAEILVMGRDDYDELAPPTMSGLGIVHHDANERAEQRLGGLGDLRSRATRVVRRGSMRRDSSDIVSQRPGPGGSRLNPMTDSPQRRSTLSPFSHELEEEELERLVTDMMSLSVAQSVLPTPQTSKALESAILRAVTSSEHLQHISMQNDQRHTMLHLAVVLEMSVLVEHLLKERIEINAPDWNGFTALHYAAWTEQARLFETLQHHGASYEALNCHKATPRQMSANYPGNSQEFIAMYHPSSRQALNQPKHTSSRDNFSAAHNNLKDDIHEAYSRAKKGRSSSGNMYVKSTSSDYMVQSSSDLRRDSAQDPSHHGPRQLMSSPPSVHAQQPQHPPSRSPQASHTMHDHTSPSIPRPAARSPSPLRESYGAHYPTPSTSLVNSGPNNSATSGPRRYLHPVDAPTRSGSLPSIRLEPGHHDATHPHGATSSFRSPGYHHRPSNATSGSPGMSVGGSSPHHHGHSPNQSSQHHPRFTSSPTFNDHDQKSPQHFEQAPEDYGRPKSDRMLPSFGLNLPVPYTYQEDGTHGHSTSAQGSSMEGRDANAVGNHVSGAQKRPGSYHSTPHDGPSAKSARTFEGGPRSKGEHGYDREGPMLMEDPQQEEGVSKELSSKDGKEAVSRAASEESSKGGRRTIPSHTCPHPDCNKSFTRPFNLRAHMRVHTAERPYKCDTCALAFSRLHDRNRHAKLHTGIKPFECSHCHHQFIRPDALRRHLGRGGGAGCGQKASTSTNDGQPSEQDIEQDENHQDSNHNAGQDENEPQDMQDIITGHDSKNALAGSSSSRSSSGGSLRSLASVASASSTLTSQSFQSHTTLTTERISSRIASGGSESESSRGMPVSKDAPPAQSAGNSVAEVDSPTPMDVDHAPERDTSKRFQSSPVPETMDADTTVQA